MLTPLPPRGTHTEGVFTLLLTQILAAAVLLGACYALFGALGRLFPCNPEQPVFFSRSIGVDLGWGVLGMLYAGVGPAIGALLTAPPFGGRWLAATPLAVQVCGLLLATDFCQYWLHRAFHSSALWPFHAVHHSAREVNWTTTFRTHPVNYLAVSGSMAAGARLVGFSETSLLVAGPILFLSGVIAHANLNWTFGPLRFVLASPVFHRWHHCADAAARERNFAPMFPVWDLMFGTFRMPRAGRPAGFGADGVPGDLIGQLAHPLRRRAVRARA
jgi:sterol desaturase/sphingolipid hydroxylase (fatty acid hydroxylase superfamily)